MKTVLMLCKTKDWKQDEPFVDGPYDREEKIRSYEMLSRAMKKHGLTFARASYEWYVGNGEFKQAWVYDGSWKKAKNVKPDMIWDKTHTDAETLKAKKLIGRSIPIYNDPEFDLICSDKWKTHKLLKEFTPKTILIHNKTDLLKNLDKVSGTRIVLKPRSGSSAKGVVITSKNRLPKTIKKDTLLQEFIPFSGVPKIVKGVSDLRYIIIDGKMASVFIRKSTKGLFTNVSRQGRMIFPSYANTPANARKIVREVERRFSKYPHRFYTIDFAFDPEGTPQIIELNAKPALNIYLTANRPDKLNEFNRYIAQGFHNFLKAQ